jgi:biopolymer transport protein ExbD
MGRPNRDVRISLQTLRVLEAFLEDPAQELSGADLPQAPPSPPVTPPEVINLDIDFDGTVVWNGKVLAGSQLESYLHTESQKDPQPEIHLRPDAHVKYDFVAQVIASAQRNRMTKMGFVNTGDFKD